jgi:hypothetical protein
MRKTGTLRIESDHVFRRRAPNSGAERERCGNPETHRELSQGTQWQEIGRQVETDVECGDGEPGARRCQDVGDGDQALATGAAAIATWVDLCRLLRLRRQRRPARGDGRHDRLVGMCVWQPAERPAEHEGTEPFDPGVQGRVGRHLAGVRRPGRRAQALVGLHVRRSGRGDHRQAVTLVRQDVGRKQPEAPAADPATSQRHRQHLLHGDCLTLTVVDQQDSRPVDARPQNRQRGPRQPLGHRSVEGSPFNIAAS